MRKTQAMLAVLALADSRPVSRDALVGLLWSTRERDQGNASLRQCVYQLRELLRPLGDDLLIAERNALILSTLGVHVDVLDFLHATAATPAALDTPQALLLQDLAGLDPAFDRWLDAERNRLAAFARTVAEDALAQAAATSDTIAAAERLLRLDPCHEVALRELIVAYLSRGRHVAAAQAYERCAGALAKIAGRSPAAETTALVDQIRQASGEPWQPAATRTDRGPAGTGIVRLGIMPVRALTRTSAEFAEGLAEEITTALTRFRSLSCVGPTGFDPKGAQPDWLQALGLDFAVEGTVQRADEQIRVLLRLHDVNSMGDIVWSRRFDSSSTDLLALQDEIASQAVAQINAELMQRESHRLEVAPPTEPTAAQFLLQAIRATSRLQKSSFLRAGDLLAAAVAQEPDNAAAHAWWAYWHVLLIGQGWAEHPDEATARTWELTRTAIGLDPYDAHALTLAGHVHAFAHHRLGDALALHDRALAINPNLPLAWLFSGLAHTYVGRHDEAIRRIRRARELSPLDPHGFFFDMALTLSYMLAGDSEAAINVGRAAATSNPEFSASFKANLAVLGYTEDRSERDHVLRHLLVLEPSFTVSEALARSPLARPEDRARFADGLRRGGLPE